MVNRLYSLSFTSVTEGHCHSFVIEGHATHLIALMEVIGSGIQVMGKVTVNLVEKNTGELIYAEFPNARRFRQRFKNLVAAMESSSDAQ